MGLRPVATMAHELDLERAIADQPGDDRPPVQPAVLQAISLIGKRYGDGITLTELAAEVYVSQFHFCRVFARATGLTPGRYLTAVRLFEAKRLLLTTSMNVSDVVCSVGYSSVGTFTTRFARAVGMTPTQYRSPDVERLLMALGPQFHRMPQLGLVEEAVSCRPAPRPGTGALSVTVELPADWPPSGVLVGVFEHPVPQCAPVAFGGLAATSSGDRLVVNGVPSGQWSVLAVTQHGDGPGPSTYSLGTTSVWMPRGGRVSAAVALRAPRPTDVPIAVSFAGSPAPQQPPTSVEWPAQAA